MNSRERVLAALRREDPDRVPSVLYGEMVGYVPSVREMLGRKSGGVPLREFFGFDITSFSIAPTQLATDFAPYLQTDGPVDTDEWGVGWQTGRYLHYAEMLHPIARLPESAIRDYPFPDLDQAYRYAEARQTIRDLQQAGFATAYFAGSVFETAWYMRSMEQLFVDMVSNRDLSDFLFDRITEIVAGSARRLAEAGLDLLILGDDIASQQGLLMSLPMWREHLQPRLARIIRATKEANSETLIFYHSDGNVWDAIPDLINTGVEVLNPVQPECLDPARVKQTFGDRLSFFGTVSVQNTMPFGKPDDVRAEVRQRIETVGRGGGLLIAPAHVLQPDTPWENIQAFFDAVREFGEYSP
jgi:uroporphyrinogen decarboxylase